MEEKVRQNPRRNKSLAQGAVGQKDQKLPLRVFEKQHGRSRDRVRRGRPRHQQERRRLDQRVETIKRWNSRGFLYPPF